MATWLIVVLSVYCGLSYGIGLITMMIGHTKFSIRLILEFIFLPVLFLWFLGEGLIDLFKDKW